MNLSADTFKAAHPYSIADTDWDGQVRVDRDGDLQVLVVEPNGIRTGCTIFKGRLFGMRPGDYDGYMVLYAGTGENMIEIMIEAKDYERTRDTILAWQKEAR